jgi:hypothetical protein
MNCSGTGQIGRTEGHQRLHANFCYREPESAADCCQKEAFREHLANHAHSSGAKCGAHGEFTAPPRTEREQKIGHIHTHNHKHQSDRAENGQESRLDGACYVVLKSIDNDPIRGTARAVISLRVGLRQGAKNSIELVPGLVRANSRTQPAHHS